MKKINIKYISILLLVIVIILVLAVHIINGPNIGLKEENKVVVYVAHDQEYSEPILKEFERVTGIKVEALYDTEATKTVGLVNRLIAEKNNPRADVFWNNEVMRSILLKEEGVLEPYCSQNAEDIESIYKDKDCYWTGFGARARVIIINTEKVSEEPKSIYDLADSKWKGKTCIARPIFGTTSTHAAAIFALLGDDGAKNFFKKLKENEIQILESNGMVRDQVVAGECYFGLTDTDDAYVAIRAGKPVKMVFPDQGENGIGDLIIPNSIMLIKGASNKKSAKALIDFILSPEVEEKLSESALQMPLKKSSKLKEDILNVKNIKPINVSYEDIYRKLNVSNTFIQSEFLK